MSRWPLAERLSAFAEFHRGVVQVLLLLHREIAGFELAVTPEDLTAKVPTGKGNQTYLRAILLVADHTAYHVGEIVAIRRLLGAWPAS